MRGRRIRASEGGMQPLAPRRVLWNLACECTRRGRIGRGVLRRRLGAFLARSGAGRLRTILRSAALAGVVAAALLGSSPALAQAIELAEVAGGQGGFIVRSEPLEISPSEASAFGFVIDGSRSDGNFASAVAFPGDLDGDGHDDMALGSY